MLLCACESDSDDDELCSLSLLVDWLLPCGGLLTSGSCCVGQSLCHWGGEIIPMLCMSTGLHSLSPLNFVYSIRSLSPSFMSVFYPGFSFL